MKNWLPLVVVSTLIGLALPGAARASGPFERIVGVGAGGTWRSVELAPSGPRSDRSLFWGGPKVQVPSTGYVRVFPLLGGLPGIPGRFYPGPGIFCLGWHDPRVDCWKLSAEGMRLLTPLARLPRRMIPPTVAVKVRHRSRVLRFADGNVFAALEMALDRTPVRASRPSRYAVALSVDWRGPEAATRPDTVLLGPSGVYTRGGLHPLPRGVWCFVAINLPKRATPPSAADVPPSCR